MERVQIKTANFILSIEIVAEMEKQKKRKKHVARTHSQLKHYQHALYHRNLS